MAAFDRKNTALLAVLTLRLAIDRTFELSTSSPKPLCMMKRSATSEMLLIRYRVAYSLHFFLFKTRCVPVRSISLHSVMLHVGQTDDKKNAASSCFKPNDLQNRKSFEYSYLRIFLRRKIWLHDICHFLSKFCSLYNMSCC